MELQPKSLNIPLERKENLGLVIIAACALASAAAWFFNAEFALAFIASCFVCLPALWLFFLPPRALVGWFGAGGLAGVLKYGFVFGYLALAKSVLVPLVLRSVHQYAVA